MRLLNTSYLLFSKDEHGSHVFSGFYAPDVPRGFAHWDGRSCPVMKRVGYVGSIDKCVNMMIIERNIRSLGDADKDLE